MYWYKRKNTSISATAALTAVVLSFVSCTSGSNVGNLVKERQPDIPAYFRAEIARLTKENPVVSKTATKDGFPETKEMQISDWSNELASFASIDLNKPAYRDVLKKDSTAYKVKITAKDPKIDIRQVDIIYDEQGDPISFHIQRKVQNFLNKTTETLYYAKNIGYRLEKKQSVPILGDQHYSIEGNFSHPHEPMRSPVR